MPRPQVLRDGASCSSKTYLMFHGCLLSFQPQHFLPSMSGTPTRHSETNLQSSTRILSVLELLETRLPIIKTVLQHACRPWQGHFEVSHRARRWMCPTLLFDLVSATQLKGQSMPHLQINFYSPVIHFCKLHLQGPSQDVPASGTGAASGASGGKET
jgi:hypothetical protein